MHKRRNEVGEPLWFILLWASLSFVFGMSFLILAFTTALGVLKWILDWVKSIH